MNIKIFNGVSAVYESKYDVHCCKARNVRFQMNCVRETVSNVLWTKQWRS